MKRITVSIGVALLLGMVASSAVAAQEPKTKNQRTTERSVIRKATVQDIDYQERTVTLKGEKGDIFTVRVGDEAKNFNNIKKGDHVTARYTELLAVAVRKSNEPPSTSREETSTRAQPGEKPSGTQLQTTTITAKVENIDRNKREVSLRGPEGNLKTFKIGKDVEAFDRLNVGDQVVATYTEGFTLTVTSPKG